MSLKPFLLIFYLFSLSAFCQDWQYDIAVAKRISKERNQPIVLVFTGSDWCPPCIRMEKNVLENPEFIDFASENIILVRADFPKKKKNALSTEQVVKNQRLADQYNARLKFPMLVVLDSEGNSIGKISGYKRKSSVSDYISFINSF